MEADTTIKPSKKKFDMELFFRALADRTRLRLLNLMGNDEICVCFFVEVMGTNQPKISRHLAYLRRAGMVGARRDGKWMHYRIVQPPDPYAARILTALLESMQQDETMREDRRRLVQACCSPAAPIQLQLAPKPVIIDVG